VDEFFERRYYGNDTGTWLIALAIVVGITTLLLLVQHALVRRFEARAKRTDNLWDDLAVALLKRTRFYVFLLIAFLVAVRVLRLAVEFDRWVAVATVVLLLFQAAVWGNTAISFWVRRLTAARQAVADTSSATTIRALGFLAQLLMWGVVLLMVMSNIGIDITALVAGLGIGGIAIALAVQNVLGDLFGALSIVLDKPFVVGDFIAIDNYQGSVEHIGIKTTRLRSLSGEQIVVANADLLTSRIRNYKRMYERRVEFAVGVVYSTPHATLAGIPGMVRAAIEAQPKTRVERVHFKGFGDSALNIEAAYFVASPDYNTYMDIQQAVNLELVRVFEVEGIEFAFPTRTIVVQSSSGSSSLAEVGIEAGVDHRATRGGSS
jgi:small-conductance mechanosensitive channel